MIVVVIIIMIKQAPFMNTYFSTYYNSRAFDFSVPYINTEIILLLYYYC